MPSPLLAHQGGWDEILLLAGPALAVILWVRWAERRARARAEEESAPREDAPSNIPADADD
ncbi:MAG TPA: hypothetical protein VK960_08645 [Acidimicrobiia bacterium]|nr:hypothetical protein [Acidimicrobiia bacterium]